MARILAFVPDLLFGSNVLGALTAAGHDVQLASDFATAGDLAEFELVVVDLTVDAKQRIDMLGDVLADENTRTLGFYAHVEAEVRREASDAGFDLVVPRSRMAREGPALVEQVLANPS